MTTVLLPHWDMSSVFSGLDGSDFEAAFREVVSGIGALRALFDARDVRGRERVAIDDATVETFESVTSALNAIRDDVRTVGAYVSAFVSTDSRNETAQARQSELQVELVELAKLTTRYEAWIGSLDVEALIQRSPVAREHAFAVRRAALSSAHQMPPGEEDLQATLQPVGSTAWTRLHDNVSSRMTARVRMPDGSTPDLPMSSVRALAHDADAGVRRAAYEAELEAWPSQAVPLAAALNGVKGWASALNARRGWEDSLAPALFANNVDRSTLEAMQSACTAAFPDFRRYLKSKARLLGNESLPWWDLFAPVGADQRVWNWDEATEFVVEQFASYSTDLAGLAARAAREGWLDAEPRVGKRDGAFCMGVRADESRVLLNFKPSFGSVSTLAHELGHAYHNVQLARRTPLQRETPMALAETASTFCQTIVTNVMLAGATGPERAAILEHDLQNACQIVVDTHSRFLFERGVFERRTRRELSVSELNELMLDTQRATYGDGLDSRCLHPYMWAVKPHYYGRSFYNWPYTFGLLFGLGLYARYREDPDGFRRGYDDLLSSTGLDGAATLCARFGIDVGSESFWAASLDQIRERIDDFQRLVA